VKVIHLSDYRVIRKVPIQLLVSGAIKFCVKMKKETMCFTFLKECAKLVHDDAMLQWK